MKSLSKYFIILAVALVFLFFPKNNAQAACTFTATSGVWSKTPAIVALGESISYGLTGNQECANKNFIVEVNSTRGIDFLINTLSVRSLSTGRVDVTLSFRASDFSGRSGDQIVYLKTKAEDGSSNTITSPNLTVRLTTGGCGTPGQPACPPPGETGVRITNFDISPKQIVVGTSGKILITFKLNVSDPTRAKNYCDNFGTFIWYVDVLSGGQTQQLRSGQLPWPTNPNEYNLDFEDPFNAKSNGIVNFTGVVKCGFGNKELTRSTPVSLTVGTGGGTGTGCGTPGQPECKPGETKTFSFDLTKDNPLKGGASDFTSLVKILAQWIFNLAIPITVAMIVYSGILFLIAQGDPGKVTKAKEVLKYAVIGLAIILIGSGFVTLIKSILDLGAPPGTSQPGLPPPGVDLPPSSGAVGNKCSRDRDCLTGLKCQDSICKRPTGNWETEPCNSARNCDVGLMCDRSDSGLQPIDGQNLGTCVPSGVSGGQIGDLCQRDSNCISGLKCNQICQRKDGNLNGEPCVNTADNCQSNACSTLGNNVVGTCVANPNK